MWVSSKFTLIFLSFVLLISACGQDEKPQKAEISVLCSAIEEWCLGMNKEFEKQTGITVNYIRVSTGEALTRLRNTKEDPSFDIWWGGPIDSYIAAKSEGLLATYDSPNFKNLLDPDTTKDPDNMWAGVYIGTLGFCTNTNWLSQHPESQAPTSWDDLLKPEFKGQIVVAHPDTSGTSYSFLSTIIQLKGEEAGWEYINAFSDQVYQFTRVGTAAADVVAGGEGAVCIVYSHDILRMIEVGQPLVLTFPSEGTGYEVGGMAIIQNAKHPKEAKKWFDWMLTPETQSMRTQYGGYSATTVKDADFPYPQLLEVTLINYDFVWSGMHKDELVNRFKTDIATSDNLRE
jgi:iron(III) transport system substrate-binding protein